MIGDVGPVRDFNFENDVRATQLLLDSDVPLVLAGFELTSQVVIREADLETIRARNHPVAQYFYDNSLAWCRYWREEFEEAGFHPWDSAAIAWLLHPEYFRATDRHATIDPNAPTLDCASARDGRQVRYLDGFQPGGAEQFVHSVVAAVY